MIIQEVSKQFNIPIDILKNYESHGLIQGKERSDGLIDYRDEDLECLGLIDTLLKSGFTPEETKKYLQLTENIGMDEQQISMLKKQRRTLLNDIHKKQQLLDSLDYMIWDKKSRT